MTLFSKKNISILFIGLVTVILLSIPIYFGYFKYQENQNISKTLNKNILSIHVSSLLKELGQERLKSTLYLATPNQHNLNALNNQRKIVNHQLQQNQELNLNQEIQTLIQIRNSVNNLSINYRLLIFENFYINIFNKIKTKVNQLEIFRDKSQQFQLIDLRENINMENSFLAFILNHKKPMSNKDRLFWDKLISIRKLVDFSSIKDKILLSQIEKIYDIDNFQKIAHKYRVELFILSKNSHYPLSFQEWFQETNKQQEKINAIEKLLIQNSNSKYLHNKLSENEKEIYRYIIIFLLILILLGLLLEILHILKKINKDETILKNTVKEIESDLDENKKKEIKEILTHNSSSEVYEFLLKEIKEPSRAKDLFLANMSHEIRTPLNGIIGFTKELKETNLSEKQTEIVQIIEESSNNLMHIVNDILDFSKLKAGKIQLEHIPFDPIEKFEAAIDTYVAKAREKEIELNVCIDPYMPIQVLGDPTKITQILNNLISNAIKFTPNKGYIDIVIKKIKQHKDQNIELEFSVKDSGIGVSHEEQKRIFDAFSQGDVSTSRKYGGTGLGLSIASQFIQYMQGTLQIESQVGKGAKFFFNIKLALPEKLNNRPRHNLNNYKIGYIPPHNRPINKTLQSYIEYQNASFLTYNQRELLNLTENELPDLLFIDYKCFDNEGEIEYFLDLPLKIVLIVADNREHELTTIQEKIDKILHKPVNFTRTTKALEVLNYTKHTPVKPESKISDNAFTDIRALVAEDNLINQKLMKSILNRFNIEVTVVANGVEALNAFKNNPYDIIFMDIQMPIMGGVEATQNILKLENELKRKHIPIIALTANALSGDKEKYIAQGMDDYLSKPMNLEELKRVLTNLL